jgi:prolyl oligopeptidase
LSIGAPIVRRIRIKTRAGHGAGTPTAMVIDETTHESAFLVKTLGMKVK